MSQFRKNTLSFLVLASLTAGAVFLDGCSKKEESSNSGSGGNTPNTPVTVDVPSISGIRIPGIELIYNVTFHRNGREDIILDTLVAPTPNPNNWTLSNIKIGDTICTDNKDTCILTLHGMPNQIEKANIIITYHTSNNSNPATITVPINIVDPTPIQIPADATIYDTTIQFDCKNIAMKDVKLADVKNSSNTDKAYASWVSQNITSAQSVCDPKFSGSLKVSGSGFIKPAPDAPGSVWIQYTANTQPGSLTIPYTFAKN